MFFFGFLETIEAPKVFLDWNISPITLLNWLNAAKFQRKGSKSWLISHVETPRCLKLYSALFRLLFPPSELTTRRRLNRRPCSTRWHFQLSDLLCGEAESEGQMNIYATVSREMRPSLLGEHDGRWHTCGLTANATVLLPSQPCGAFILYLTCINPLAVHVFVFIAAWDNGAVHVWSSKHG